MKQLVNYPEALVAQEVSRALAEDLQDSVDWSASLIDEKKISSATLICKEEMVVCGIAWVNQAFSQCSNSSVQLNWLVAEGDIVAPGTILCQINGNAQAMLSAERTALNFMQTLSGTATTTRKYVLAVAGYGTQIMDTRKTIPGLRLAQKYAVRIGGGFNQRIGLYDGALIKENHIIANGGIKEVLAYAKTKLPPQIPVQCEVETLTELHEAVASGARLILLDNMSLAEMREAVAYCLPYKISLEISGNVTLTNLQEYAATGVQRISIGALTKNIAAIDLSLRFV